MKLMSGRQYKNDLSDIVGILWKHQKIGAPITCEAVDRAIDILYGGRETIPPASLEFLDGVYSSGDYEAFFSRIRESEKDAKEALLDFEENYPHVLNESNSNDIIEQARRKREQENHR